MDTWQQDPNYPQYERNIDTGEIRVCGTKTKTRVPFKQALRDNRPPEGYTMRAAKTYAWTYYLIFLAIPALFVILVSLAIIAFVVFAILL